MHTTYMLRLIALAAALTAIALAAPARAQYWLDTPDGFELVEVTGAERLSLAANDPLVAAAEDAAGLILDGLFRPDASRRRFFEMGWTDADDPHADWATEYEVVPTMRQPPSRYVPVDYHFEGGEVLIGFGPDPVDEWGPYYVISYFAGPDGSVEELTRWECGAQYCFGIYALDLTNDGVLEIMAPWTTGFGGNGGVELFAVVPTGGFSGWGDDLLSGSYWSSHGSTTLLDYDGDGDWELTAYIPLLFNAAGYMFTELMTFERERYAWVGAEHIAPELYEQQYRFYEQLLAALDDFARDPEAYRLEVDEGWGAWACEIDGELRYLDAFVVDELGTLDDYWVSVIREYVESWRAGPGS